MMGRRPVLLVEGDGDRAAVPILIRRTAVDLALHDFDPAPRPIKTGSLAKVRTPGTIERFVQYALRRDDGDSVILVLDCDDECAWREAHHLASRCVAYCEQRAKRLGIVFMCKEFESIFLHEIATVAERYPEFGWAQNMFRLMDGADDVRGCKEKLSSVMRIKKYKETQHQAKFTTAVNITRLREASRSVKHLSRTLEWMSNDIGQSLVYPFGAPY